MRRSPLTLLTMLALLVALVASPALARNGPPESRGPSDTALEHQRIVEFWTPARMAAARPMQMVLERPVHHRPDHAGRGGGGDDDGGGKGNGKGNGKNKDDGTDPEPDPEPEPDPDPEPDPEPDEPVVTGAAWTAGGDVVYTTGKVFFRMGGSLYACSAGAVAADKGTATSLAVTAGHCVHGGGSSGAWATDWLFIPAYDGSSARPLGEWTATSLFTTTGWANNRSFSDDAGFAVLTDGGDGSLAEALGTRGAAPSAIVFDTSLLHSYSFGYPAAGKYKGRELTYCAGPIRDDLDRNDAYAMGCDMTGGTSGGPWLRGFDAEQGRGTVHSVNSYRYSSTPDLLFGPVFGSAERAAYVNASDGSCSTGSPCVTR